jgi:hypothetical protein
MSYEAVHNGYLIYKDKKKKKNSKILTLLNGASDVLALLHIISGKKHKTFQSKYLMG